MPLLNEETNIKALEINLRAGSGIGARIEIIADFILTKITRPIKIIENFGIVHIFKIKSVFWTCACLMIFPALLL